MVSGWRITVTRTCSAGIPSHSRAVIDNNSALYIFFETGGKILQDFTIEK